MKTTYLYTLVSAAAVATVACGVAAPARAQSPVRWSIAPLVGPLKTGVATSVHIEANLLPGWHIYSITQPGGGPIATRISLPSEQSFEMIGAATPTPAPRVAFDDAFHMNVELHEKSVGFAVPVRYTGSATARPDSVRVNVRYQVCNASLCYPPQTAKLAAPVTAHAR